MNRAHKRLVQRLAGAIVDPICTTIVLKGWSVPPVSPRTVLVIEHMGRTSGTIRQTPVGFAEEDGELFVVAEHGLRADWVRNGLAAGRVQVHGREHFEAHLEPRPQIPARRVWAMMRSRSVAAFGEALSHEPMVILLKRTER